MKKGVIVPTIRLKKRVLCRLSVWWLLFYCHFKWDSWAADLSWLWFYASGQTWVLLKHDWYFRFLPSWAFHGVYFTMASITIRIINWEGIDQVYFQSSKYDDLSVFLFSFLCTKRRWKKGSTLKNRICLWGGNSALFTVDPYWRGTYNILIQFTPL